MPLRSRDLIQCMHKLIAFLGQCDEPLDGGLGERFFFPVQIAVPHSLSLPSPLPCFYHDVRELPVYGRGVRRRTSPPTHQKSAGRRRPGAIVCLPNAHCRSMFVCSHHTNSGQLRHVYNRQGLEPLCLVVGQCHDANQAPVADPTNKRSNNAHDGRKPSLAGLLVAAGGAVP